MRPQHQPHPAFMVMTTMSDEDGRFEVSSASMYMSCLRHSDLVKETKRKNKNKKQTNKQTNKPPKPVLNKAFHCPYHIICRPWWSPFYLPVKCTSCRWDVLLQFWIFMQTQQKHCRKNERFSLSESFMPDMSLNELQQQHTFFGRVKVGKPAAEAQQRGCDHNPVQFEID